jgi:hypothetical protein
VLIYCGSTHNFTNHVLAKLLNCLIYPTLDFQVMIADEGTINCLGKCHNIKLIVRNYLLDIPIISISMGGGDVVLGSNS